MKGNVESRAITCELSGRRWRIWPARDDLDVAGSKLFEFMAVASVGPRDLGVSAHWDQQIIGEIVLVRFRLPALIIAASIALTGCGGGSGSESAAKPEGVSKLSAKRLLTKANQELQRRETVSVVGSATDDGTKIAFDMTYAGSTVDGTITTDGLAIELLSDGSQAFFKGSDRFYEEAVGADAENFKKLVGGRWVLFDENDEQFSDLASFVDRVKFLNELLKPEGPITKGKEKTIGGVECVPLNDTKGTLWLNKKNGSPVRVISGEDELTFDYATHRPAEAPGSRDIVDLAKLAE